MAEVRTASDVIGQRVNQLRKQRGWSIKKLAEVCVAAGAVRLTDNAIENIEYGRRDKTGRRRREVSVEELLTLAVVLEVPPVWLIADPTSDDRVPVTENHEVEPWQALLWAIGRTPLTELAGNQSKAEAPLRHASTVAAVVERFSEVRQHHERTSVLTPHSHDDEAAAETERRLLRGLVEPLTWLVDNGYRLPSLPGAVSRRAAELAVDLPSDVKVD